MMDKLKQLESFYRGVYGVLDDERNFWEEKGKTENVDVKQYVDRIEDKIKTAGLFYNEIEILIEENKIKEG